MPVHFEGVEQPLPQIKEGRPFGAPFPNLSFSLELSVTRANPRLRLPRRRSGPRPGSRPTIATLSGEAAATRSGGHEQTMTTRSIAFSVAGLEP
jgi:hypothetical protein